jgi:hypothetical protein
MAKPIHDKISPILTPDLFPDWVLAPPSGSFTHELKRQSVLFAEFRQWQTDRDTWISANHIVDSRRLLKNERERRIRSFLERFRQEVSDDLVTIYTHREQTTKAVVACHKM